MVFESVLADILNRYLKPYVKKLDTSQLKIGVWKGNVSLGKLELKEDIFDELDLPVKIKASYIGGIVMKIPWKKLAKDPIIINIDEVYIIAAPYMDCPYDAEKEKKRVQKEKENQIQKIENAAKKLKQKQKKDAKSKGKEDKSERPDTFTEKLVAHLVKNLQVRIRDIHVRYEDNVTNPLSTIAVGATLHSLVLQSTDANWKQCVVKETATLIYKLLELNSASMYWTPYAQSLTDLPGDAWMDAMRDQICRPGADPPAINKYILLPMSAIARVKLNLKPGVVLDIPQLFGSLECEEISVSLSEDQFKSLMITLDAFNRHKLNQKYLKYKPVKPVLQDKRAWWLYAYKSVVDDVVKRKLNMWSWNYMKEHRAKCRTYISKYHEKLTSLNTSTSLLKEIESLEHDLDVFNIIFCRKTAKKLKKKQVGPSKKTVTSPQVSLTSLSQATPQQQATPIKSQAVEKTQAHETTKDKGRSPAVEAKGRIKVTDSKSKGSKKEGFWSRFKKSAKEPKASPLVSTGDTLSDIAVPAVIQGKETSEEDRKQFYEVIGYSEDEEYVEYPKEYIAHHIVVLVKQVTIELAGKKERLATVITKNVAATILNRPSSKAVSVNASVGGINVTGVSHDSQETLMVTADGDMGSPLVNFQLEMNPLDRPEMDLIVRTNVQPLKVIYDEATIDGLIGAFRIRKNIHLQELTSAASSTLEDLRTQTTAGFQEAIQNRKQLEVDVTIHSPYIIIPETGHYNESCHLLIVDLGKLSLSGTTKDPKTLYKELASLSRQTFSTYYDTFSVQLTDLQILVAKPGQNWQKACSSHSTPLHILDPTGFEIELKKSIVSEDALLPSLQIAGKLNGFEVKLNDDKLSSLLKIITSLQLPPPALKNTTDYYNELPPPPTVAANDYSKNIQLARTVSVDTMSIASFDDEDDLSITPTSSLQSSRGSPDNEEVAHVVFTDVKVNLTIRKISVSLSQVEKGDKEKTLLLVGVNGTNAEVFDRSWDLQGKVSVRDIVILDYITLDSQGKPTYLLKTSSLTDGNFLSARFVSITSVGKDFAAKYTGLGNTATVEMSLIQIRLHEQTVAGLIKFGLSLKPALEKPDTIPDESLPISSSLKPADTTGYELSELVEDATPPKEFHIEASFEGIDFTISSSTQDIVHSVVKGFFVNADLKAREKIINASMKDLVVSNPVPGAPVPKIVHKIEEEKDMINLQIIVYPNGTKGPNKHDLDKVDASISAEAQRLKVHLDTQFFSNVLGFIQQLKINSEALLAAYTATTGTATATASAIKDTASKTAFRMKLNISLHAPLIIIPYESPNSNGTIHIDLGDFNISNRFVHGYDIYDTRGSVVSLDSAHTILDRIEVKTSSICVCRECHMKGVAEGIAVRSDIMDPLEFTAVVTRNLSPGQTLLFPDVSIKLNLENEIQFHLSDEDIQAFVTIALTVTKIADVIAPPTKPVTHPRTRTLTKGSTHFHSPKFVKSTPGARLAQLDPDQVIKLNLEINLSSVSLELSNEDHTLIKGMSTGVNAGIKLTPKKVIIKASVDKLGITDLEKNIETCHKQVLSFVEGWEKAVSVEVDVPLQKSQQSGIFPLATVKLNVAQLKLLLTVFLIERLLAFVLSLDINPQLVKSATKRAQDGASVATELVQDVFVKLNVSLHAPTVFLPVDENVAFMIDLGEFQLNNEANEMDTNLVVDTFRITLDKFKASRVLLGVEEKERLAIVTERILIQPYSMMVNLQRNLCPWNTKLPSITVTLLMGNFELLLGQEDLDSLVKFGLNMAEKIVPLVKKKGTGEIAGAVVEGLTEDTTIKTEPVESDEEVQETYKKVTVAVSLTGFKSQIFKNEPTLSSETGILQVIPVENGLASFELVLAEVLVNIQNNGDVDVTASIKDFALLDLQVESQNKNTGNRVLQHYTSNPLNAYTGRIDRPVFKVEYYMINKEHSVLLEVCNILLLSDIAFVKSIVEYFKALFKDVKPPQFDQSNNEDHLFLEPNKDNDKPTPLLNIPPLKISTNIKNIRVAIIENAETTKPQALTLKVSVYCLLQLNSESNLKQASFNVADLGITTCSFYDLETNTSVVLLPCSMFFTISGPLDKLNMMDINGTIETISLKLSPPIVRLIIHAVQTLALTSEKPKPPPAPTDLWQKKPLLFSNLWYLLPVPLYTDTSQNIDESVEDKGEVLTLSVEGFEIMLETEATDRAPATPVLSINASTVIQVFDWTGLLKVTGDVRCEASYFNQELSSWEPLLEPLELSSGKLHEWTMTLEVTRSLAPTGPSPQVSISSSTSSIEQQVPDPKFLIELKATDPVQLTVTRTSLQLIKDLAEAYRREYGKKVEGKINVKALTGSPFTIINKLGIDTPLFVKPGKSLKILGGKPFAKLLDGESVDLLFQKNLARTCYASLVTMETKRECTIDLSIGKTYHNLMSIPIDVPGNYYYSLLAKEETLTPNTGIVVDIAVTGAKKTLTIRSSILVHNHMTTPIDLLVILPMKSPFVLTTVEPNEVYAVPFNVLFTAVLCVRPRDIECEGSWPRFTWQALRPNEDTIDTECTLPGGNAFQFRVIIEQESYKSQKGLPEGGFPHHIFHVYAPAVLQNLLPEILHVEADDGSLTPFTLKPGETQELHLLNLSKPPPLIFTLPETEMCGKLNLPLTLPDDIYFTIGKDRSTVKLSILHEDLGYHRLSVYCPFWMINKTGLYLEYKDEKSGAISKHGPDKQFLLFSCEDKNCKVRLCCHTDLENRTDWSNSFSLQAVGTSGRFSSKLGDTLVYHFGVAIHLSKFTLSKLVVITPYYLLANQSSSNITVLEERSPGQGVVVAKGQVVPFWPLTDSNRLSIEIGGSNSVMFNYKKSDSLVLKLAKEPLAVCVDIQETESANVVTFSSYFESCTPVQVVNLFSDTTIIFKQDSKGSSPWYSLDPGESVCYTWDDPTGTRLLRWNIKYGKVESKPIDITKDGSGSFNYILEASAHFETQSLSLKSPTSGPQAPGTFTQSLMTPPSSSRDMWLSIEDNDNLNESLVSVNEGTLTSKSDKQPKRDKNRRGHWKSFIDNLQRTLLFTEDDSILDRIKAADYFSQNLIEVSLSLRSVGLSLVDNKRKREVAYIGITQSGVIWQVARKKGHWKTLPNPVIALLEQAHQSHQMDLRDKDLVVNLETMEMFAPLRGALRRTHYDGVKVDIGVSDKDYSLHAKIGYIQIDNQLPFAVYPQMLYPLPPPPTVASTIEPKPFIEASIFLRKTEQLNVNHFKYVHVLVQKMAVNVDLGFILSLLDLLSFSDGTLLLEAEYVRQDIEYTAKTLQEIALPALSDESVKRNFFDVLHISPIKITLSFNVKSVGRNKSDKEVSVGDRFLHLFLHSLGVILTSVQEVEMKFSLFHLVYIAVTINKLIDLFVKHYRTQALVQIHRLVLGLDVLGNPVKVVRGVVEGTFDLFYEPIKGSVLGPEEFAQGLAIGLKSFFGGTVGGVTGAGARITGAFGDVVAKLSFDEQFLVRREQEKVKSTKFGSKLGGFLKNVAEGVTGVVVQPVKGAIDEGALGLLKGTGRGLVGLLVRPAGGLIDLTSGALEFVTRKTSVGNVDIVQLRPPRYIARDGLIKPFSAPKAIGNALLTDTDEGHYTDSDCYIGHQKISSKPLKFLIVTDRRYMIIERHPLLDGWKSTQKLAFKHVTKEAISANNIVYVTPDNYSKYNKASEISLSSDNEAIEVVSLINSGYKSYCDNFSS